MFDLDLVWLKCLVFFSAEIGIGFSLLILTYTDSIEFGITFIKKTENHSREILPIIKDLKTFRAIKGSQIMEISMF